MDPLTVIFIPGALTLAALAVGPPVAALTHMAWRRRALRRVARGNCGRCDTALGSTGERFLVTGVTICEPCARTLRGRLSVLLLSVAAAVCVFAVTSGSALVLSAARGGPGLGWWLDGRWIPLLLPSAGVALVTWSVVALSKRANRLAPAHVAGRLPGEPPPN